MTRARLSTWVIALGVLGNAGCGLVSNATHTLCSGVQQSIDDVWEKHRNAAWAKEAWARAVSECADQSFSEDHERGFKTGFTYFVTYGGNGEPPPLPPEKYRSVKYQTPQGFQAIEDWFAGYRHGVAVARSGNYRDLVTGPSSLRPPTPPAPMHPAEVPAPVPSPELLPGPVIPAMPPAPLPPPAVEEQPRARMAPPPQNAPPPPPVIQPVAGTAQASPARPKVLFRISINWDPWKLW
jgi:hypothetical protein